MGIDIYAAWRGMKRADKAAQITGFSVHHGHVGYLREAYHGEPYATRVLVPEAFERADWVEIPARLLRERLPQVLDIARKRERAVYGIPRRMRLRRWRAPTSTSWSSARRKSGQVGCPALSARPGNSVSRKPRFWRGFFVLLGEAGAPTHPEEAYD